MSISDAKYEMDAIYQFLDDDFNNTQDFLHAALQVKNIWTFQKDTGVVTLAFL